MDNRFPANRRVKMGVDFDRAYRGRKSAADTLVVVYAAANGLAHARLGLSVSRKVGNAVRRNRWKRLLREAFRLSQGELPAGMDFIIIPRADAEPELKSLSKSLVKLARLAARKVTTAENEKRRREEEEKRRKGDEEI